jgi:hypothetical protein
VSRPIRNGRGQTSKFRVFLSAVTSEFGTARDALANDLQSHDVIVPVQRSFRHDGQLLTYLRISGLPLGLLLNFDEVRLKDGIRRRQQSPISTDEQS